MRSKSGGARVKANGGMDLGWPVHPEDDGEEMFPVLDDLLAPDEIEQIGDLGTDGDDADGPEMARTKWTPMNPREFFLLSRMDEAIKQFKAAIAKRRSRLSGEERVSDEEWRRLGDEALGLVQKAPKATNTRCNELDTETLGTTEMDRGIEFLKDVVVLETRVTFEIGMAKHHMERAMEATRAISRLTMKTGQEQRA